MSKVYSGAAPTDKTRESLPASNIFLRALTRMKNAVAPKPKNHTVDFARIPSGWYLYEFGQNPIHGLWHMALIRILDNGEADHVESNEQDTPIEAFDLCVKAAINRNRETGEKPEDPPSSEKMPASSNKEKGEGQP